MDGDKFINTTSNSNQQQNMIEDENNFFLQSDKKPIGNIAQTEPFRHINDFDANILQEGAYREVTDEIFKLEYKISKIETEIVEIDKQIQTANEIYDYYLSENLSIRKLQLKEDLRILTEIYKEASISAKISGGFSSKVKDGFSNIEKFIIRTLEKLLSKISGKFSTVQEVKMSLNKLENINKSVDELMNCKYPYGEADYRYEQLSRYIARANSIQSEISRFVK